MPYNSTIKVSKKELPCGHFDFNFSKGRCKSCAQKEDSKPLERTPLKRSTKPIKKSGKPIAKVSAKRKVLNVEYKKVRDEFMDANKMCMFPGCRKPSTDLHHSKYRGANLSNVETFIALCREHHNFVHEHTNEAKEMGLIFSKFEI